MHVLFQTKSVFTDLTWLLRSFLKIITELIYLNDFIIVFLFIMFIIFILLILFIIFIISLSLLYLMILSYLFQSFTKFFIKGPFSISSRVSWMSRANRIIKNFGLPKQCGCVVGVIKDLHFHVVMHQSENQWPIF